MLSCSARTKLWLSICRLQETCLILPRCKLALDIGRCPQPSVYQQTVLISHGHLDHIGGVTFHAASRCDPLLTAV